MKLLHHTKHFFLILSCYANVLFAQNIEEQMTKKHPDCQTMFMNAMDILPGLYRNKQYDSMSKAIDIWERSCSNMPELRITKVLLHMEEGTFSLNRDVDGAFMEMLDEYGRSYPSPDIMQDFNNNTGSRNSFYRFSSVWAKLLMENKNLNENEKFICKVLKGEIRDPQKEITKNPLTYPELSVLLEKNLDAKRKRGRMNLAVSTGIWVPTQNLSTLGVHPSIGLHIGFRDLHNQLDLSLQFRFIESANPYAVKVNGRMDSTDYYFGGYVGLDYTYYLVTKKRYEFGVLGGMGYDGFDFAPQPYDYYYDYPYYESHVTISSFNANAGLRFNYYFTNSFYVGLQGRYNIIQYNTHGGSNLSGDAVSIDLIFGIN